MSSDDSGGLQPANDRPAERAGDEPSDDHVPGPATGGLARTLERMPAHGFDLRVRLRREGRKHPTLADFAEGDGR